ncbi:MAG: hypothetical protein ABIC68_08375 [Candidatus Omnitrophota bacterium]
MRKIQILLLRLKNNALGCALLVLVMLSAILKYLKWRYLPEGKIIDNA